MKLVSYIIVLTLFCLQLQAQENVVYSNPAETKIIPSEKIIHYKLAENIIPLKIQQYGDRNDFVFINLHDDETTSVEAAKRFLEQQGGLLIEVENNRQRLIRFRMGTGYYQFDPNGIFAKTGITKTLRQNGKSSPKAFEEVEKFGRRILQLIPESIRCIIALHNNTPGFYSALDYLPGKTMDGEAKKVYINPDEDPDDFFLTTDTDLYTHFRDKGYNAILQDNRNCTDDGSLSVYCGRNNIGYINCETEIGKMEQYYKMIRVIFSSSLFMAN